MIYLSIEDLKTDSFHRFIDESTKDFNGVIDKAELRAIGKVKPYLRNAGYDTQAIFDKEIPLIDEALIEILVCITLKKIFGRNAARKVPSDLQKDYEEALKELDKIAAGKITLDFGHEDDKDNPAVDEDESTSIFGDLTNQDFYI